MMMMVKEGQELGGAGVPNCRWSVGSAGYLVLFMDTSCLQRVETGEDSGSCPP